MSTKKIGKSRRYGGRFASPNSSWSGGHRPNPAHKKGGKRGKQIIIKAKA